MRFMRFSFYNLTLLLTFVSFLYGGNWLWFGFVFLIGLSVVGDRILPHDKDDGSKAQPFLLNALLYSILPLLILNVLGFLWQIRPDDWLGMGNYVQNTFAINIMERKELHSPFTLMGGIASLGLFCASAGTNVAHELVHRTWDSKAVLVGRWLLSFTFDTSFSIEHVYGHHANIATRKDPASARRGEVFFAFLFRSTWFSNVSGWQIEAERLRKRNRKLWSWDNRFLRGQLMSLVVVAVYFAVAGWPGIGYCLAVGIYGKAYLELVNYIEHYGLVRVPGTPVEPRHSWNSNHRISSLFLYNLNRHSHHHAKGHLPYWKLQPMPDAPSLPYGYMSMMILAIAPPIFKAVMEPRIQEWDSKYATAEEKALLLK